jgi:hypothetical protein
MTSAPPPTTPSSVAAYFVDQLLQVQPQAQALLQQRYGWPDPIPPGSVAVQELAQSGGTEAMPSERQGKSSTTTARGG